MKNLRKYLFPIAGVVLGLIGGFLYYRFVGCKSGSCAITSNPYMTMLWGAGVGYLFGDTFSDYLKKKRAREEELPE